MVQDETKWCRRQTNTFELEQAGWREQASERQPAGETDDQSRTGNRNLETNLRSEFQEPG